VLLLDQDNESAFAELRCLMLGGEALPEVQVIDGFRWAILGGESTLYLPGFFLSLGLVFFLLVTGIWYFRKMERTFADVI